MFSFMSPPPEEVFFSLPAQICSTVPSDSSAAEATFSPQSMDAAAMPSDMKAARTSAAKLEWEAHKQELQDMFLTQNMKFDQIVVEMRTRHGFDASVKQYKDKFKLWQWRQNLPASVARFIVRKDEQRKGDAISKNTVFRYGGKEWNPDRARISAKRSRMEFEDHDTVATPEGLDYATPMDTTAGDCDTLLSDTSVGDEAETVLDSTCGTTEDADGDWQSDSDNADDNIRLLWQGKSPSIVKGIYAYARLLDREGGASDAEKFYQQALQGFKTLLGPLHSDTTNVVYRVATFYFEQDRILDAYKILEDSCRVHVAQLGLYHRRSQQFLIDTGELLNGWNKQEDALMLFDRIRQLEESKKHGEKHLRTKTKGKSRNKNRNKNVKATVACGDSLFALGAMDVLDVDRMPAGQDSNTLGLQLSLANSHLSRDEDRAERLFHAILKQCPKEDFGLSLQRFGAFTGLLKINASREDTAQKSDVLRDAYETFRYVLTCYPWTVRTRDSSEALRIMESMLELGSACLQLGRSGDAESIFTQTIAQAESTFQWDDERTIWMLISVGLVYQRRLGWCPAEEWFDRAYSAALSKYKPDDGIILSLEAARDNCHFSYVNDEGRPYKTIFGVNGLTIRPNRLHIE